MIMYAIKLGGNLWVATSLYSIYPASTSSIIDAKMFKNPEEAERLAKKTHGTVKAIKITELEDDDSEIDMLRASIKQLQMERDAALNELNLYKLNTQDKQ